MKDHVGGKGQLVMPGSIIVRPFSVGMVIPKLRADRNELIGPPRNADRVLGIVSGEASSAPDLVIKIFVSQSEKGARGNAKHRVVDHCPLGRIAVSDGERPTLKRHFAGRMINRVSHEHVPRFRGSVDLVVELVCPGSNKLLHVVVTKFSVVNYVVARVDRIPLVR